MKPIPLHKLGAAVLAANAHLLNQPPPTNRVVICAPGNGPAFTNIIAGQIPAPAPKKARKPRQPTKTECEYAACYLMGTDHAWEDVSFRLADTHFYTPDWVVRKNGVPVECVEVSRIGKNGFRKVSYQRSRLAFDQCRKERPGIKWTWAEKQASGSWQVS